MAPPANIPPLQHGWQWGIRDVQVQPNGGENVKANIDYGAYEGMIEDSDDDIYADGSHSDESQKRHKTRKKNKWFKKFFNILDKLSLEETNSSVRQWHTVQHVNTDQAKLTGSLDFNH
ncbi:hypothetical protein MKW92_035725 [Papaver armeniacum]|nr:hypothetical protein MKW92_035725 [Papaver armeniacum]